MRPSTAAIISILEKVVTFGILAAGLIVLGRLLSPVEHGTFALILAAQAVFRPIVELGLGPAYLQTGELEDYTADVFFVLNIACGLLNTIVLACLAPIWSWLYETPILLGLMLLFAASPILGSFGWQAKAMLMRRKRFVSVMVGSCVPAVAGVSVSIWMAYRGYSVWALCTAPVVSGAVSSLMLLSMVRHRYRLPNFAQIHATMDSIRFSFMLTVTRIVNGLQTSLDKLVVGKFYGGQTVGGYTRALQLASMPDDQIRNPLSITSMSYLCRLDKDSAVRNRAYKAFLMVAMIGPAVLSLMLMFMGDYLIVLVMGKQWVFAGPYVRIFGIYSTGLIIRGSLSTIHYCENRMKQWIVLSGLGVAVGLGPALICAIMGLPTETFAWVISLSVLGYWVAVLTVVTLRMFSAELLGELARTAGLAVAVALAAGYGSRMLVEQSSYTQALFVKVAVVSAITLAAVIVVQLALNRSQIKMVWRYATKRQDAE